MKLISENNSLELEASASVAAGFAAAGTYAFIKGETANATDEVGVGRVIL